MSEDAVRVVPPAPDGVVALDGANGVLSHADLDDVVQPGHLGGRRVALHTRSQEQGEAGGRLRLRLRPELAGIVSSPAPQGSGLRHDAAAPAPPADLHDAVSTADPLEAKRAVALRAARARVKGRGVGTAIGSALRIGRGRILGAIGGVRRVRPGRVSATIRALTAIAHVLRVAGTLVRTPVGDVGAGKKSRAASER